MMWELIVAVACCVASVIAIRQTIRLRREKEKALSVVDSRDHYSRSLDVTTGELRTALNEKVDAVEEMFAVKRALKEAEGTVDPDEVRDYHADLRMEYDTWKLWMERPETREFMRCIAAGRSLVERKTGEGKMLDNSNSDATQARTAHAVGYCKAITDMLTRIKPKSKTGGGS